MTSETLSYSNEDAVKYGMKFDKNYHGTSGPLKRTIPRYLDEVALPWIEAVKSLGVKFNPDSNAGDNTGVWITTVTLDGKSIRSSAASAYFEPNQTLPNLTVITGAEAARVITSGNEEIIATGVEYFKDGVLCTIKAKREVILSAGSYKTPQILELSGIGDPEVLTKFGIDVVLKLPGDHVTAVFTVKLKPGLQTWAKMSDPEFARTQQELYETTVNGMLSGLPSAFAFLPLRNFDPEGKITTLADKESLFSTATSLVQKEWVKNDRVPFLELSAFDRFIPGTLQQPAAGADYMTSAIILLHPFSHGSSHIPSNIPTAAPSIDHRYLEGEVDLKVLVEGYKLLRKIYSTAPLKDLIEKEVSPGPEIQTDEEICGYIRKTLGTTYHPIGTAGMLPRDEQGVVDSRLKVHGTKNLRVVDASILPIQLSAPLQGTLYAIAEKVKSSLTIYTRTTFV
ncbi:hypothetical protein DXG01_012529 [Tephrocybe rancida]|nr:hypothetical protein DXG01_012529 [Tephrocybe rancida]